MPVSRGRSPGARAFILIYPLSNHGITILYSGLLFQGSSQKKIKGGCWF